jgi:hypothetical protein
MHPLVRNLYKRVLCVGHDYPTGMNHVRDVWKKSLRNPHNCPSCYDQKGNPNLQDPACQEEILFAVHRGRKMVQEMIGVIQLKKYRAMKARYGNIDTDLARSLELLQREEENQLTS